MIYLIFKGIRSSNEFNFLFPNYDLCCTEKINFLENSLHLTNSVSSNRQTSSEFVYN